MGGEVPNIIYKDFKCRWFGRRDIQSVFKWRAEKIDEPIFPPSSRGTIDRIHRQPLAEFSDYVEWISTSGFLGGKTPGVQEYFKSVMLTGANMAWRIEAIRDCPLASLYKHSKKGFQFEQLLAYCARKKGFDTFKVLGLQAPIVWHIVHKSISRDAGFWHEFWLHYDRVMFFRRLKRLGADVSPLMHVIGSIIIARRKTFPRLLATLYAWFSDL